MLKMLNGEVLIEEEINKKELEKSEGGVFIIREHNTQETTLAYGKVVSVAPYYVIKDWRPKQPTNLKVGDKVAFFKYNPRIYKENNNEYLIIKELDVYGVIED